MTEDPNYATFVCETLSTALGEKVLCPGSEDYYAFDNSYWRHQERSYKPRCIVSATSREDVASAVRTLRAAHVKFAIRGGGHTVWSEASNIDGGVTIDLRRLNNVALNNDKTVISVGGGALWGDVYRVADQHGLGVIGGREASVGVAGLTLGGGVSYFSARKGFACDNVLRYEVVLADGSIVSATPKEHSDLYFALKGGANNLGVVTCFDLATFPQGNYWGGQLIFPDSASPDMLEAFTNLNGAKHFDVYASLMLGFSWVPGVGYIWTSNMHYTKDEENPKTFQPITSIEPQLSSSIRIANQTSFAEEFVTLNPSSRAMFMTTTYANDLDFSTAVWSNFRKSAESISSTQPIAYSLTFQPISRPFLQESQKRGGNLLGLHPSEGPLVLCLVSALWNNPSDDQALLGAGRKLIEQIEEEAKERGLWNDWVYLNYASDWQDPLSGYGEDSRQRLRDASRKYDPDGVFQKLVPGGFKLWS